MTFIFLSAKLPLTVVLFQLKKIMLQSHILEVLREIKGVLGRRLHKGEMKISFTWNRPQIFRTITTLKRIGIDGRHNHTLQLHFVLLQTLLPDLGMTSSLHLQRSIYLVPLQSPQIDNLSLSALTHLINIPSPLSKKEKLLPNYL